VFDPWSMCFETPRSSRVVIHRRGCEGRASKCEITTRCRFGLRLPAAASVVSYAASGTSLQSWVHCRWLVAATVCAEAPINCGRFPATETDRFSVGGRRCFTVRLTMSRNPLG